MFIVSCFAVHRDEYISAI